MPKQIHNALSSPAIKGMKPGRHADGGGLYLLVKPTGTRSWLFRAMINGKRHDIGLGPADGSNLANAREKARDMAKEAREGRKPVSERRKRAMQASEAARDTQRAISTFKAVAEAHIAANEAGWRNDKHRQQWRNTLASYAYPVIGELPIAEVGTSQVLQILEPIWTAKPETASRLRGRIETILDAAKVRELREGENPARWRGHLDKILPKVSKAKDARNSRLGLGGHHKALPYASTPAFVAQLRKREAMAALALEFVILTAARTSEALGATWDEIDFDKQLWTVPAGRMKAGKEHRVPLSARALEILESLRRSGSEWIFASPSGGRLSGMAMAMLLRRMDIDTTVHGFRSSFRDWAAESTGFPQEVCEMALAHAIGNKVEASYRRGDLFEKRRRLMDEWAGYCGTPVAIGAHVTPIRAEAR